MTRFDPDIKTCQALCILASKQKINSTTTGIVNAITRIATTTCGFIRKIVCLNLSVLAFTTLSSRRNDLRTNLACSAILPSPKHSLAMPIQQADTINHHINEDITLIQLSNDPNPEGDIHKMKNST